MDRKTYPTDLANDEKAVITPLLPADAERGRPLHWSLPEIRGAIS